MKQLKISDMAPKNSTKGGNHGGNGGNLFSDICVFLKDKFNHIKGDNVSVNETMDALNEQFTFKESDKLPDTEKTAFDVMSLLMPVLDAFSFRRDESLLVHDTKINKLQVGMRNIEYANDALDQQPRKLNIRVSGLSEVEGNGDFTETLMNLARAMKVELEPGSITDAHRISKKIPGKSRQMLVKFENRGDRLKFLAGRNELKQSGYEDVYISEDLTPLRFKLFHVVRKSEDAKNAYTRDGKYIVS